MLDYINILDESIIYNRSSFQNYLTFLVNAIQVRYSVFTKCFIDYTTKIFLHEHILLVLLNFNVLYSVVFIIIEIIKIHCIFKHSRLMHSICDIYDRISKHNIASAQIPIASTIYQYTNLINVDIIILSCSIEVSISQHNSTISLRLRTFIIIKLWISGIYAVQQSTYYSHSVSIISTSCIFKDIYLSNFLFQIV